MRLLVPAVVLLSVLHSAVPAQSDAQQAQSGSRMRVTTRSADARSAFYLGLDAVENLLPHVAEKHLARALEGDSALAIARGFYAAFAPSLSADQRNRELQRAAADAMEASVSELLMVLALRAETVTERRSLLKAALDAAPDDAHIMYQYARSLTNFDERSRIIETLSRRFPDFAPGHNLLAYVRARDLGDLNSGIVSAQRYLQLAPANPNARDTYAELLQWSGRLTEAAQQYQQAIALDSLYAGAHSGLAEIAMLQGSGAIARGHYGNAMKLATSQQHRLEVRLAIAASFIVDGNVTAAMNELKSVAQQAEAFGLRSVAAQAFRNMAVIDGAIGTKTMVDLHVRRAEALSAASDPVQIGYAAAAYALAGDLTAARPAATTFAAAANSSGSPLLKRQAAALNELVGYASGQVDSTQTLSTASGRYGALGKVLLADIHARRRSRTEARAIAREAYKYFEVDLFTIIARRRARAF